MRRDHDQGGITRRASLLGALGGAGALVGLALAQPEAASAATTTGISLIGDSWAAGLHADPSRALGQVAAKILGTGIRVDAVSGTGYVATAGRRNYLQRASGVTSAPGLVIVQGGSNDQSRSASAIHANAVATYAALRKRLPNAQLLALGPGPDPEPVTSAQRAVDATLADAAQASGVHYVSMLRNHWIPDGRWQSVIDPDTDHPSVQGQAYLGTRLAAAIRLQYPTMFT